MSKGYVLPKQTFWDYVRDPLGSLSFYFDIYKGKNFKYAENMIKLIGDVQDINYQISEIFDSVFEFIYKLAVFTIKAVGFIFKCLVILAFTLIGTVIALGIGMGMENFGIFMEMPFWVLCLFTIFALYGISLICASVQSMIWFEVDHPQKRHLQWFIYTNILPMSLAFSYAISIAP